MTFDIYPEPPEFGAPKSNGENDPYALMFPDEDREILPEGEERTIEQVIKRKLARVRMNFRKAHSNG